MTMRAKTIWTVAAGTTAAVLIPGVAYAMTAGGPVEGVDDTTVEQSTVQAAERPAEDASTLSVPSPASEDLVSEGAVSEDLASAVPPVELMLTANSPVSAQTAVSALSAQSAPTAVSPVSAQSAPSPVSADSPQSPDSAN
ncbi:hypothetical protein ACT3TE_14860 [Brachybacterium sp. AOP42-B2-9]|uniref:hypothetical protein n=1 Tax=Brachybacterium sp. AOP42-B2-9 TaxID=3457672 RepID=UPI00403396BF